MNQLKSKLGFLSILVFLGSCSKNIDTTISKQENLTVRPKVASNTTSVLFNKWDFEGTSPLQGLELEKEAESDIAIANDPVDPANKVMKCSINPSSYRTEASMADPFNNLLYFYANSTPGNPNGFSLGSEVWLGGRIYKPAETGLGSFKASIVQLGPVNNPVNYPGLASEGFAQLRINDLTDKWNWRIFQNSSYTPIIYDGVLSGIQYGRWENFVIHCKYRSDSQGLIEVWNDGVKTVNITGPNAVANNRIRIKWGVYLGIGNYPSASVSCYFDDIRVGGSASSYQEVVPQAALLTASADTYVHGANPDLNYGISSVLNVKDGGSQQYNRIAYLKFDLSTISFSPGSAKLILTTDPATQAGTLSVNECSPSINDWSESMFTWNSAPAIGNLIAQTTISAGTTQQLVIDISSYVQSKYASNNKIFTVALTGNNSLMSLKSINGADIGKPRLSLIK